MKEEVFLRAASRITDVPLRFCGLPASLSCGGGETYPCPSLPRSPLAVSSPLASNVRRRRLALMLKLRGQKKRGKKIAGR